MKSIAQKANAVQGVQVICIHFLDMDYVLLVRIMVDNVGAIARVVAETVPKVAE